MFSHLVIQSIRAGLRHDRILLYSNQILTPVDGCSVLQMPIVIEPRKGNPEITGDEIKKEFAVRGGLG